MIIAEGFQQVVGWEQVRPRAHPKQDAARLKWATELENTLLVPGPQINEPPRSLLSELRADVLRASAELQQLRAEVRQLKAELAQRPATLNPLSPGMAAPGAARQVRDSDDPHGRWIEEHLDVLAKYPDQYVAIDPEQGVVVQDANEREFRQKLRELDQRDAVLRARLLVAHTSMFL
jgi:hypothetical protein